MMHAVCATLLGLASAFEPDEKLSRALAQVVDAREFPTQAAALEVTPYRMLLDRVRVGPDERTLAPLACLSYSLRSILASPDDYRGKIVTATGIIVDLKRVDAPGVGGSDGNAVYAGILVAGSSPERMRATGVLEVRKWAFRALRRRGNPILYVGDHVHLSGYVLKNVPILDARGRTHWLPLLVTPWPTHFGKWWPASVIRRKAGGLLPATELRHEQVRTRPVVDAFDDGAIALNGVRQDPQTVAAALRRFAARRPGRVVVARAGSAKGRAVASKLLASAGLIGSVAWKHPPAGPAGPPPATRSRN
jgi:hypothetical protein